MAEYFSCRFRRQKNIEEKVRGPLSSKEGLNALVARPQEFFLGFPLVVDPLNTFTQGWGAGVGAGCFWLLGAGAAWKKKSGAGAAKK